MGSLVGGLFGVIAINALGLPEAYVVNFVALGVAGCFSGVVRAPVTAVVLVFELTGSLDSLLSVSIVAILAFVTANVLRVDPFYEHLLAGLLGVTPDDPLVNGEAGEKILHTYTVGAGARIENMLIRDIPWPDNVRVVTVERAGQEIVPTGSTRIMALDNLLVIMDTDTESDAGLKLQQMTRASIDTQWTPSNAR
jgi:hypothetical protein